VEINAALAKQPETVNSDPYGAGWMIAVKLDDVKQLDALLDAATYRQLIGE